MRRIVGVIVAVCLGGAGAIGALSDAAADHLPVSDTPTVTLSCGADGSVVTISWPAGAYGPWSLNEGLRSELSGGAMTYAAPFDQVFAVADGFVVQNSDFKLSQVPDPNAHTHRHPTVVGETCPPLAVDADFDCGSGDVTVRLIAGVIDSYVVTEVGSGAVLAEERFGVFFDGPNIVSNPPPTPPADLVTVTLSTPVAEVAVEVRAVIGGADVVETFGCPAVVPPSEPPDPPVEPVEPTGPDTAPSEGDVVRARPAFTG